MVLDMGSTSYFREGINISGLSPPTRNHIHAVEHGDASPGPVTWLSLLPGPKS